MLLQLKLNPYEIYERDASEMAFDMEDERAPKNDNVRPYILSKSSCYDPRIKVHKNFL